MSNHRCRSIRLRGYDYSRPGAYFVSFESAATRRISALRGIPGAPVRQRNYWEHIIRDERALDGVRRCIVHDPPRWHLDRYSASRVGPAPRAAGLWRLMQGDGVEPIPAK